MYLRKLVKKKMFKIRANYIYPYRRGWIQCELLSIELTDKGTLLNISISKCYSGSVYLENIKKGDIKFK